MIWLDEKWNYLQLIAFIILVTGSLIYNEIIIVPIKLMRYGTKKEIENKKKMYDEVQNKSEVSNTIFTLDNERNIDNQNNYNQFR